MIPPREVVINYNAEIFNIFFTFQRNILIIYIIKYTYINIICKIEKLYFSRVVQSVLK